MSVTIVTAPQAEPIHVDAAKAHLRVDITADDVLISGLIEAARRYAEIATGRALVVRTLDLLLDRFPDDMDGKDAAILLPQPPLVSVTSITYLDDQGASQTLSTALYQIDAASEPARIRPAPGEGWPATEANRLNAVTVRYIAGHATPFTVDASTDVITPLGLIPSDGDVIQVVNSGGALPLPLASDTNYYVRDVTSTTFKLAATAGGAAIDLTSAGTGTHFLGQIPSPIVQGVLLLVAAYYENREALVSQQLKDLPPPLAVRHLLDMERVYRFV